MGILSQFQQTLIQDQSAVLTISAGQSLSNIFNCGGAQLRGFIFPDNWTACNITFNVGKKSNYLTPLRTIDGVGNLTLPSLATGTQPLVAYYFDAVGFIQLSCNLPQVEDVIIDLLLQPIYQGIHG